MAESFNRFSKRSVFTALFLSVSFLFWTWLIQGIRTDHIILLFFSLILYFLHPASRNFISAFFIFIVYWIVYDSMRAYPNYIFNPVHISEPYHFEKTLFGINTQSGRLTPNEWMSTFQNSVLDLLAGLFYINWVPVPLAFAFYLMIKDRIYFMRFAFAFVLTNFIGFIGYYLYPAAPPWYVELCGFDFDCTVPSSTAGLSRVDTLLGFPLFHSIYSKNANIFAAIPSLHGAYPLLVLYYGLKRKMGWINILFIVFAAGIWFAAVYSYHHYVIDLLLGAACAFLGVFLVEWYFIRKSLLSEKTI